MSLELEVAADDGFQRVSPCNPKLERAWMRPLEGDPPTWIVMKLTAFKCWKIAMTSTSLREY